MGVRFNLLTLWFQLNGSGGNFGQVLLELAPSLGPLSLNNSVGVLFSVSALQFGSRHYRQKQPAVKPSPFCTNNLAQRAPTEALYYQAIGKARRNTGELFLCSAGLICHATGDGAEGILTHRAILEIIH